MKNLPRDYILLGSIQEYSFDLNEKASVRWSNTLLTPESSKPYILSIAYHDPSPTVTALLLHDELRSDDDDDDNHDYLIIQGRIVSFT